MRKVFFVLVAGAILPVSTTCAATVMFDNTNGQFAWLPTFGSSPPNYFSVLLPPSQQAAADGAYSLIYGVIDGGGSNTPVPITFDIPLQFMRVARAPTSVSIANPTGQVFQTVPAAAFNPGELVGAPANFQGSAAAAWRALFANPPIIPLLGQHTFVGLRLNMSDGLHYAFVEFDYQNTLLPLGGRFPIYQPVRWGYETTPETPIMVVPGAGGAGLMVLSGLVAGIRRRQRG